MVIPSLLPSRAPTRVAPRAASGEVTDRYQGSLPLEAIPPALDPFLSKQDFARQRVVGDRIWMSDTAGNVFLLGLDGQVLKSVNRDPRGGFVAHDFHPLADGGVAFYEATVADDEVGTMGDALTVLNPDLSQRWSFPVFGGDCTCEPAVLADQVVAVHSDMEKRERWIRSFDAAAGHVRWSHACPEDPRGLVATGDGRVVLVTRDGAVHCWKPDGEPAWGMPPQGSVSRISALPDGTVVLHLEGRGLLGVDPQGQPAWTVAPRPGEELDVAVTADREGTLYVPVRGANLLRALRPETGEIGWELPLPIIQDDIEPGRIRQGADGQLRLPVGHELWIVAPDGATASRAETDTQYGFFPDVYATPDGLTVAHSYGPLHLIREATREPVRDLCAALAAEAVDLEPDV
ncbi:MAG: PQQ-binding-like beta-propeller repeat protein, partial [Candidatus Eremiobacterota bacterium]